MFYEIENAGGERMRIVSVTIRPLIADCSGAIYFTDLQVQEGDRLTGYTTHTEKMLRNSPNPVHYHNGVVRSGDTIIIFNLSGIGSGTEYADIGGTSTGLDCYIYPLQNMAAGSIEVSQGMGSHKKKREYSFVIPIPNKTATVISDDVV